ncbi:MAG TPA: LysR substrate-binding domain-containing protein, partial [Paracoccaceae bacterium]|nr:LysR substrate-binding domain-containing protein [Paracoccaceae bacterium]
SYADQVLALFRDRDLRPPNVREVKELQTALGLVAAECGVAVVPASVERLRRDNVLYVRLDEPDAKSPIIMSTRRDDPSPELALILKLIKRMYRDEGITFGV